jgi:hypothetical protein
MAKKAGKAKSKKTATKKPLKSLKQLGKALRAKAKTSSGDGEKAAEKPEVEIARKRPLATRLLGEIKLGKRFRKDLGDIEGLARSIDERGALLQPVVITPENKLIAGERRMAAWKLCNLSQQGKLPIPVNVVDIDALIAGEWDENRQRKDFTHTEAVAIAAALRPIEEKKARERQKAAQFGATPAAASDSGPTMFGTPAEDRRGEGPRRRQDRRGRRSRSQDAGEGRGRGRGRRGRSCEVRQAARTTWTAPAASTVRSSGCRTCRRREDPQRAVAAAGQRALSRRHHRFPWPADPDDPERTEGRGYYPYPTMTLEQIAAFARDEVKSILHADAVVGHVDPELSSGARRSSVDPQGLGSRAGGAADLEQEQDGAGAGAARPDRAAGHLQRAAVRSIDGSAISTRLDAPAGKEHSEKPAQSYVDFERVVAAPRYFELFARRPMPPNWDGHGDQVGKLVDTGTAAEGRARPDQAGEVQDPARGARDDRGGQGDCGDGQEDHRAGEQLHQRVDQEAEADADRQGEAGGAAPRARGR